MNAPIAAIAFDLDGTLVDSAAGVALALNAALATLDLPGFALPTVRGWIGDGPDALIQSALAASRLGGIDPQPLAATLRETFDAVTLHDPMAQGTLFPGVDALLRALPTEWPLVVVTNKPTPLARAVLDATGWLHRFAAVHGADTPALRKPAPLSLQRAAHGLGVPVAALLMVGDGPADLQAARAAGCRAAWADWGYGQAPAAAVDVWRLAAPQDLLARLPSAAARHESSKTRRP